MEWITGVIIGVLAMCVKLVLHIHLPQTIATTSLDPYLLCLLTVYELKRFGKGHITQKCN